MPSTATARQGPARMTANLLMGGKYSGGEAR
jgi:hypothetical protein